MDHSSSDGRKTVPPTERDKLSRSRTSMFVSFDDTEDEFGARDRPRQPDGQMKFELRIGDSVILNACCSDGRYPAHNIVVGAPHVETEKFTCSCQMSHVEGRLVSSLATLSAKLDRVLLSRQQITS
jgi:hypothetical protein